MKKNFNVSLFLIRAKFKKSDFDSRAIKKSILWLKSKLNSYQSTLL